MTTKAYTRAPLATPGNAGKRVARNKWNDMAHLSDDELAARGVPMRMIRRLRSKA